MEHPKASQPGEQAARTEGDGERETTRDDGTGRLESSMEALEKVLDEELERAQASLRRGEDEPTRAVGPPTPLPPRTECKPLTRGTTVGRYVVLERLGTGGMGEVYAAFDPSLNRRVALKLLLPGGEDPIPGQAHTRLLREAQSMARLSHPHVMPVHDIGEHGERVFIALEHVEGSTLRQWLKEGTRSWREVIQVLAQAGEGLVAAHAAGLVHRDFKPDNVLVGRDGRVLVYDFGLACEQGTGSSRAPLAVDLNLLLGTDACGPEQDSYSCLNTVEPLETPVTRAGLIMGTPGYMAPEQYRQEPLTGQADQFSFCATLHYALYGEHAFEGQGAAALARATLEGRLRPMPRGAEVPAWVRHVVLRGLSPKPADRYPSMEALLEALLDEPRSRRWRQVLISVAVVFLGAVVAGAVTQWRKERGVCEAVTNRMEGVWDAPRQEAVRRAFLATGLPYADDAWNGVKRALDAQASSWMEHQRAACEASHRAAAGGVPEAPSARAVCLEHRRAEFAALTTLLASADARTVEHAVEAARGLSELAPCAPAQGASPGVPLPRDVVKASRMDEGYAQLARARALRLSGQSAAGLSALTLLASSVRTAGYAPLTAEVLLELGRQQLDAGDARAEQSLREASWTADEVGLDTLRAEALVSLTRLVAADATRVTEGHDWYQQARALLVRTRRQGRLLAELESAHGLVYAAQGDPVAAEASQLNALDELERISDLKSPEGARVLQRLGRALCAQGRHTEALTQHLRAHEAALQTLGAAHPRVGAALVDVGASLSALGRPTEALAALRQGVDIMANTLPPQHPLHARALDALGSALWHDGQGEEARRVLRRAVDAAEQARGPEHPDTAQPRVTLGRVLVEQGRPGEALALFTRALRLRERTLGAGHPDLAAPLTGQGEALLKLDRPLDALAPLERALTLRTGHPVAPESLAETRFLLARALWDSHQDTSRARLLARQAEHALERPGSEALRTQVQAWLAAKPSDE